MKIEHKFMEEGQLVAVLDGEKNEGSDHPGREDSNKESPNKEDLNKKDPGKVRRNFSEASGKALDRIWTTSWVKEGISPDVEKRASEAVEAVSELRNITDKILIVSGGATARAIAAVLKATYYERTSVSVGNKGKCLMAGNSLSTSEYKKILDELQDKKFGMIAISCENEPVEEIAACATAEKLIRDRHGAEELDQRITVITGKRGRYLPEMASRGAASLRMLPDDIYDANFAGSDGFLIPLAAAGVDVAEFLSGFKSMLASTIWDLDGDRYGICMAELALEGGSEDIIFWQEEMSKTAEWLCSLHRRAGVDSRIVYAPGESMYLRESAFQTHIFCADEDVDIMTPVFPGASREGTLSMLAAEKQEELFVGTGNKSERMRFTTENCKAYSMGEAMAFFQLSNEITMDILENEEAERRS